jgi:hypothetical protein
MAALSNYLEEKIVDHFLRNNPATSPTTVYLALFTSDPGEDGNGTEAVYANYARQSSVWTSLDGNGQTKNSSIVTFPANGNASASETISHGALFDALTGGNMLLYGALATSKTLAVGDILSFSENALTLTLD